MLNILSGYDFADIDTVTRTHLLAEAMRRAYRDRGEYLGDTDFVEVPLDRSAASPLRGRTAHEYPKRPRDAQRSLAGHTRCLYRRRRSDEPLLRPGFGRKRCCRYSVDQFWVTAADLCRRGTGVLLNNEMDDFSMKPGVANGYQLLGAEANAIAPGKRMLSSMTPTILVNDDGLSILGTPGGSRIITMVLLAALEWMDGGDAASMVSLPRIHHQYFPDQIEYEDDALSLEGVSALEAIGHSVARTRGSFGNMHVVTWDFTTGEVEAASDPRGIGEPRFRMP